MRCQTLILSLLTALGAGLTCAFGDQVLITLKERSRAEGPVVFLRDIAFVEAGDPALRHRIERLDVAEVSRGNLTLSKTLVKYRLILGGIPSKAFSIVGPSTSIVDAGYRPKAFAPDIANLNVMPVSGGTSNDTKNFIAARQIVRVSTRAGSASVSTQGEALQSGKYGDTIRVKNVSSGKILLGKIIGAGEVEIAR